jgi:multiple sugar transport system ATP-binding protein
MGTSLGPVSTVAVPSFEEPKLEWMSGTTIKNRSSNRKYRINMAQPAENLQTENSTASHNDINVHIQDLTKEFTDQEGTTVVAVDGINLQIKRGEFLVLVGPSGCGKTTTLRSVAGLEDSTSGTISINGNNVEGLEPRERDVSMVFQNYALYPHKTVRENLSFPLQVRGYDKSDIDEQITSTAKLLGIHDLLDRKPSALSGGQQQRVALGRAIVREPEVFLMDEPLSNLDAKLRIHMRTELNKLHKNVGKTTIYVTHDQAEAMTLGDRVAVMDSGTIRQVDPPQVLYDSPANLFVAGFIGEPPMNFFSGEVVETSNGYSFSCNEFTVGLMEHHGEMIDEFRIDPKSVTLGIRPEDIYEANQFNRDSGFPFEAYIRVVEPLGSDVLLTLSRDRGFDREFTASISSETNVETGTSIDLIGDLEKIHLFDESSGENILYNH